MSDARNCDLPDLVGSATIPPHLPAQAVGENRHMNAPVSDAMPARRVIVVEDEMLIGMLIEDMLTDMGHTVVGVISRVNDALATVRKEEGKQLLAKQDFQLAILDVHLNGQAVFPVADALIERGIPFVFATGYGERGLPDQYRSRPILQKPFAKEDLERTLAAIKI